MRNSAFSKIWILVILVALIGGGFLVWQYFLTSNDVDKKVDVVVNEDSVSVAQNGKIIQTIPVDVTGLDIINSKLSDVIINNQDINFDGYNDLAVYSGIGYGGVNIFYTYYIFNHKFIRFEKDSILADISNPNFNSAKQQITSSYKSGPEWYIDTFQFDGSNYKKISSVPESQ